MNTTTLLLGNCLERMKEIPDNSIDSIVTDPPYGLGKEPDAVAMLRDWIETGHHEVKGKGFMGKEWDAFVPQPQVWRECLRVLKPGGHLLAFAGTRTQDLMCLGLRLAGFEIRDMVAWVYGSGFPKSLNVSKALDKMAGAEREVVGVSTNGSGNAGKMNSQESGGNAGGIAWDKAFDVTAPATEAAKQWDGWGTALKPALEPITLARKPLDGTVAANVLKWHVGGLNIDGCRVAVPASDKKNYDANMACHERYADGRDKLGGYEGGWNADPAAVKNTGARWPANVIHDGSDEVIDLFPDTKSGNGNGDAKIGGVGNITPMRRGSLTPRNDHGSAARFFYCAKTSKADRNDGLDGTLTVKHNTGLCKEENMDLVELLQRVTSASTAKWGIDESGASITVQCQLDSLSITLMVISKITTSQICSLLTHSPINESIADANCETESGGSHVENAERLSVSPLNTMSVNQVESVLGVSSVVSKMLLAISDVENWKPATNFHATVKPTDLMRYLCRLITPQNGMILDPYMGSGSTGKAAMMEGFSFTGIEQDDSYFAIAETRIKAARANLESSNPFNL